MDIKKLHAAIVDEFQTISALTDWVGINVAMPIRVPVDDILTGKALSEHVTSLLQWSDSQGQTSYVLKLLADDPPNASRKLPALIYKLTNGEIRPAASITSGIPPVDPHRDWFVMGRPFVNRDDLRSALATLDTALDGADSVLVIDGDTRTGKTHGIRLATHVAPPARSNGVDMAMWGAAPISVGDLAQAIFPSGTGLPHVDPTKEDAAVPCLRTWLVGKLKGTRQWIIIDHCNRLNLSSAAETLLFQLAWTIEKGWLPGVRLVLADVQRSRLPESLKTQSRYDHADLPDPTKVETWCQTLASHLGKKLDDATLKMHVDKVFAVDETKKNAVSVAEFEERLRTVFLDIQAT